MIVKRKRKVLKPVVWVVLMGLIFGAVVGGSTAWLSSQTEPIVNTFTYGDINITLEETPTGSEDSSANIYKMIPGETISKDPKVTVIGGSENCWLFVKLEESQNFNEFMSYVIADGWDALDEEKYPNVYYRVIEKQAQDQAFEVILNNTVTVKGSVTKEMLNALDAKQGEEAYPTLTITAYAVQRNGDIEAINTALKAWELMNGTQSSEDAEAGTE